MPKRHLAIEINTGAVRFVKLDGSFVVSTHEFLFLDKQDYRYNAQLSEFLEEIKLREIDFDECSIAWSAKQSTLVPANVYNESEAASVFKLCFGDHYEKNEIDYNRIADPQVVNVYWIPFWVKTFFVIKFPRVVMQHEATHLIRGIFKGSTFKPRAIVVFHEDFFTFLLVKENNLHFYSNFDFTTAEDAIYYISFTLQQKEWFDSPIEVVLNNGVGSKLDLEELEKNLMKVLAKNSAITIDETLLAKYQELCV